MAVEVAVVVAAAAAIPVRTHTVLAVAVAEAVDFVLPPLEPAGARVVRPSASTCPQPMRRFRASTFSAVVAVMVEMVVKEAGDSREALVVRADWLMATRKPGAPAEMAAPAVTPALAAGAQEVCRWAS
jgi:hypothetical protein